MLEAEAERHALLLLAGHFATERFAVELLADRLAVEFPAAAVWASRTRTRSVGVAIARRAVEVVPNRIVRGYFKSVLDARLAKLSFATTPLLKGPSFASLTQFGGLLEWLRKRDAPAPRLEAYPRTSGNWLILRCPVSKMCLSPSPRPVLG